MNLTVQFDFAVVKDFTSLQVAQGQTFAVTTDHPGDLEWFSNNDQVCEIEVNAVDPKTATIKAAAEGKTKVLFVGPNNNILHSFEIEVKATVKLNPSFAEPILKT